MAERPTLYINIQALRAYAAIVVVLFHTGYPWFLGLVSGDFGVDVFFVISGFLMAHVCHTNPDYFIRRRLIRILPLYWLVLIGVFILSLIAPALISFGTAEFAFLIKSLLFIPYARPDGNILPLMPVGWSLNYEMFFYLLLAIALAAMQFFGKQHRKHAILLFVPVLLLVWWFFHQFQDNVITKYFSELVIFEFLLGIACYYFYHSAIALSRLTCLLITLSMLVMLPLLNVWLHYPEIQTVRLWLLGIPSFFLVYAVLAMERGGWAAKQRWVIALGDASYSIYLCHLFVVFFFAKLVGPLIGISITESLFLASVAVGGSLLAGLLTYRWLERPMTRYLRKEIFRV